MNITQNLFGGYCNLYQTRAGPELADFDCGIHSKRQRPAGKNYVHILRSIGPSRQDAAGGETGADRGEQHEIAFSQFTAFNRVTDSQRNGRRRRIAILVNVLDNLALVETDLI